MSNIPSQEWIESFPSIYTNLKSYQIFSDCRCYPIAPEAEVLLQHSRIPLRIENFCFQQASSQLPARILDISTPSSLFYIYSHCIAYRLSVKDHDTVNWSLHLYSHTAKAVPGIDTFCGSFRGVRCVRSNLCRVIPKPVSEISDVEKIFDSRQY